MAARLIDGKALAKTVRAGIGIDVAKFRAATGTQPHLTAILVGDDPASAVYVRNKHRACEEVGLSSSVERMSSDTSEADLLRRIDELNANPAVHGILVQLPLPATIRAQRILDAVHPLKDVDAFHPENVGRLVQGRPRFLPCTPHRVLLLLKEAGVILDGKHVVVLGRSEIVGKPLAGLLLQKGTDATVTLGHSRSRDLPGLCRQADVVVAAIGRPEMVTAEWIKPGAVVIDVGTNRVGDRLVGDVAFEQVSNVASAITPVPGGVGPMTITMLLANTLQAAILQQSPNA